MTDLNYCKSKLFKMDFYKNEFLDIFIENSSLTVFLKNAYYYFDKVIEPSDPQYLIT